MLKLRKKTGSLKVVCPWDPAIDNKKSDIKAYLEDLDLKHLSFKAGQDPTRITITEHYKWVVYKLMKTDMSNPINSVLSCFRYSIEKIENVKDHILSEHAEVQGSGNWEPSDKVEGPRGTEVPVISEEDAVEFFNMKFQTFIATIVQARSNLIPGTSKPYAQSLSSFLPTEKTKK